MKKGLLFLFLLIFLTACEKHKEQKKIVTKKEKPSVTLEYNLTDNNRTISFTFDENTFTMSGTKGIVLLTFFTSWCPSCKAELTELTKLHQKFHEQLDIVGLQLDEKKVQTPFFVSDNIPINRAIAKKIYGMLHAPASMPVPLSLLLKDGKYVIHYIGAVPLEMMELDIKKIVGE